MRAWDCDLKSCGFENLDGGLGGFRLEIIVEGVGPQNNFLFADITRCHFGEPGLEGLRGEGRNFASLRHSCGELRDRAETWNLRKQVGKSGCRWGQPRPLVDPAERVRIPRTQAAFP